MIDCTEEFLNFALQECVEAGGQMEHIVGARFILQGHRILNSNDESKLVQELRSICHASNYNVTVFHPYFIYFDQVFIKRLIKDRLANNFSILVFGRTANNHSMCSDSCWHHDVCLPHLYSQPCLLSLGCILHCQHRDWSSGFYDILGNQS